MSERCDVCGDQRLNVEAVELPTLGEVAACPTCRWRHDTDSDGCLRCGSEDAENYVELDAPLGAVEHSAYVDGELCGDCAAFVASVVLRQLEDVPAGRVVDAAPNLTWDDLPDDRRPT